MYKNLNPYLSDILDEKSADFLLINYQNEFLTEYNEIEDNPRFYVTNFSGSAGNAIFCKRTQKFYLFVDGRYHQQADYQVNKDFVQVVKLDMKTSFIEALKTFFERYSISKTLLLNSKRVSLSFFNILQSKNIINIKQIDYDPILKYFKKCFQNVEKISNLEKIDEKICGKSVLKKLKILKNRLENGQAFFITELSDIAYLTNLRSYSIQYSSSFKGKLLIDRDECILFYGNEEDREFSKDFKIFPLESWKREIGRYDSIFINKNAINLYDYNILCKYGIKILFDEFVPTLKAIKTENEIEHLKSCFKRTDIVLREVKNIVESCDRVTEKSLSDFISQQFRYQGARGLSFLSIVAFGSNSSIVHYSQNDDKEYLKDNQFVLIDCGAYFEGGYSTDVTCTFFRGDRVQKEHKQVYTAVLKAFLKAFNKKSNLSGYNLDKVAREEILDSKEKFCIDRGFIFNHSLGHSVGINVHDLGSISLSPSRASRKRLIKNMVFTIEPGLYKERDFGVRLERCCFLNKKGKIESFSSLPFDRKLIDFSMLDRTQKRWLKRWMK